MLIFAKQILIIKKSEIMIDTYNTERPQEDNECAYCGEPCEGRYCDKNCKKAYENDN